MERFRHVRAWLLALCLAAPLSLPMAATVTKPLDNSATTKAQAELASRLTMRNQALRELAKQVNVIPQTPSREVLTTVRSELVQYQRAVAGTTDSTLGGTELRELHVAIQSALRLVGNAAAEPQIINAVAAMRRVQTTQLDARNAKVQLRLAQMDAIRKAAGTNGPILLVPSQPLAKKPASTRTTTASAAREGDTATATLTTGDEGTQAAAEPIPIEITVTDGPPAPSTATFTLPNGQTVSATQAQMFVAAGGQAAVQSGAVGALPPVAVMSVDSSTLFDYAAQQGSFSQLEVPSYCSAASNTSTTKGSSVGTLFSTDVGGCEDTTSSKMTVSCHHGRELHAGMCYTPCRAGYEGHATMCVFDSCPSRFTDQGLFCGKPAAYGRGAGYPWKLGDKLGSLDEARARCRKDNPGGCEKNGQIIYPKCRDGYNEFGSNLCTPDCPANFQDIGVSCKKPLYDRGRGTAQY
jgi:hypothetical protein